MRDTDERRSVFKKGKGRAFLKFLLGELILAALVCVGYLFLMQGDIASLLPAPAATPEATVEADSATPSPAPATATPAPTPVATLEPTATPTPAPTGTPVPYEELSLAMVKEINAPVMPDEALKLGLSEFRAFTDAGQNVLVISGYAYIEGRDAANSKIYLQVAEAGMGDVIEVYPAVITPEKANLSFEENSGSNLENAFFTANLDISEYWDNSYLMSVVVVNGNKTAMNYFDDRTFHFMVVDGQLTIDE